MKIKLEELVQAYIAVPTRDTVDELIELIVDSSMKDLPESCSNGLGVISDRDKSNIIVLVSTTMDLFKAFCEQVHVDRPLWRYANNRIRNEFGDKHRKAWAIYLRWCRATLYTKQDEPQDKRRIFVIDSPYAE